MEIKIFKTIIVGIMLLMSFGLISCDSDANVASRNISQAADNFEVMRQWNYW